MRYFHPATEYQLQCDLDNYHALEIFRHGVKMLKQSRHVKVEKVVIKESKTDGHYHGVVFMRDRMPVMERLVLQGALGDDPIRAMMNWGRVKNKDPFPVLLVNDQENFLLCDCKNTKKLPRCKHLREIQTSKAEFLPARRK